MKNNNLSELLNKRATTPSPELTPDPFLPTRIEALINADSLETDQRSFSSNWSYASIIATAAIILGIYIGSAVFEQQNNTIDSDVFNQYSEAFYQSGLIETWDSSLENGGTNQ